MTFRCFTDKDQEAAEAPKTLGSPLTAASWYYNQLPPDETDRSDLAITVSWDNGTEIQKYAPRNGRLVAI